MAEDTEITKILVGIGRLEEKADATNNHLAQLNGSVRTLYGKAEENKNGIESAERNLLHHQINCAGLKAIAEIDRKLCSGDFHGSLEVRERLIATEAKEANSKNWQKEFLFPLIKWVLAGVVILFLLHAHDILKALKL